MPHTQTRTQTKINPGVLQRTPAAREGGELRSQFFWGTCTLVPARSVVRHLSVVVQLGPQPHAWRPCPRRSPGGAERSPRRGPGPPTGPTRDPIKIGRPRTSATDGLPRRDAGRPSTSRPSFLWQPTTPTVCLTPTLFLSNLRLQLTWPTHTEFSLYPLRMVP